MESGNIHLGDTGLMGPGGETAVAGISVVDGRLDAAGAAIAALRPPELPDQAFVAAPAGRDFVSAAAKRAVDIVMACIILVLAAPLMAVVAVCVAVESRGPIIYRARRVGRWGEPFDVLKFRKMRAGVEGGPLTTAEDARFTRIGRLLGRTKLDELPQLVSVVRGEMSLIGPRPEDPLFVNQYADAFETILRVRPGVTGLSQLAFRAESRILDANDPVWDYQSRILPQKIELDHLYIAWWNPLLDARILFWTIATALLGIPIAVHRSSGRMSVRFGRGGRRQMAHVSSSQQHTVGSDRVVGPT
ncbi:MAG: sugar transferase [Solirubrobacteraceae bacterium]